MHPACNPEGVDVNHRSGVVVHGVVPVQAGLASREVRLEVIVHSILKNRGEIGLDEPLGKLTDILEIQQPKQDDFI